MPSISFYIRVVLASACLLFLASACGGGGNGGNGGEVSNGTCLGDRGETFSCQVSLAASGSSTTPVTPQTSNASLNQLLGTVTLLQTFNNNPSDPFTDRVRYTSDSFIDNDTFLQGVASEPINTVIVCTIINTAVFDFLCLSLHFENPIGVDDEPAAQTAYIFNLDGNTGSGVFEFCADEEFTQEDLCAEELTERPDGVLDVFVSGNLAKQPVASLEAIQAAARSTLIDKHAADLQFGQISTRTFTSEDTAQALKGLISSARSAASGR